MNGAHLFGAHLEPILLFGAYLKPTWGRRWPYLQFFFIRPPIRPPAAVWIFWKRGNPDFWKSGKPDFWDLSPGNPEKWDPKNEKKIKTLKI